MKDSAHNFDEEALRKKIREELERKHQEDQEKLKESPEIQEESEEKESYVLELLLKEQIENDVFSRFPEFIKCENHLNEVRWLTPTELEEDFEYYPVETSRWHKFKRKFAGKGPTPPDSLEIREMLDNYRQELETEAKRRVTEYHDKVKQSQKHLEKNQLSDLEQQVYEEELDRFYGAKKGYKKYKNHIGDTQWLTKEELEQQDEYIDEVLTRKQIVFRAVSRTIIVLLSVTLLWYLTTLLSGDAKPAYLLVEMENAEAFLYVDQSPAFGFKANEVYVVDPGNHEIMVLRPDYISSPQSQQITFAEEDTVRISLEFSPEPVTSSGVVILNSNNDNAAVLVDGQFRGVLANNPSLLLPAGDYTISVKLDGYTPSPRQQLVSISPGDSLSLSFRLIPSSARKGKNLASLGMIEVTSNIKDADIYLDGQKTGYKTDYILQKISIGGYLVKVEKEGYVVYPEEKTARLTKDSKTARVHFNLTSTTQKVVIKTNPDKGEIFINGKSVAKGTFRGTLQTGEYEVSFGGLSGFKPPASKTIAVSKSEDNNFSFNYIRDIKISFQPGKTNNPDYDTGSTVGHILKGIQFITNSQAAPEIVKNNPAQQNVWLLNYAFQYSNPPGTDAVAFRFKLPDDLDYNQKIYLKLWIYQTKENYPLTLKGKSAYRVIINNSVYNANLSPKYPLAEISENIFERFEISQYLRRSYNTIIISASTEASAAIALWKVEIE